MQQQNKEEKEKEVVLQQSKQKKKKSLLLFISTKSLHNIAFTAVLFTGLILMMAATISVSIK
jgi:hypothetical protein